jgi:4-amino-4-deoxy-L-arabinose transferase-like glycosyltransferase
MPDRTDLTLGSLLVLALFLRLWDVANPGHFRADEGMKIPAARNYVMTGHVEPDRFFHPPLKYLMYYGNLKLFGDNPYGWRMLAVLAGTVTVLIVYLLARELFDRRVALIAGAFLAVDPTHISQSRTSVDEVLLVPFFLFGCLAVLRCLKNTDRALLITAGLCFGISLSIKVYHVPAVMALGVAAVALQARDGGWKWSAAGDMLAACFLIPCTVYVVSYYGWFGRGYDFLDFLRMQGDSYRELQSMRPGDFRMGAAASDGAWAWLVKPVLHGFKYRTDGTWSEYHADVINFLVWMLTLPSLVVLARRAAKTGDRGALLLLLLFVAAYFPFVIITRPMFIYSSIVVLPFVVIAVSVLLVHAVPAYKYVLAALMAGSLLLYPLVIGKAVPDLIYDPIVSIGNIHTVEGQMRGPKGP